MVPLSSGDLFHVLLEDMFSKYRFSKHCDNAGRVVLLFSTQEPLAQYYFQKFAHLCSECPAVPSRLFSTLAFFHSQQAAAGNVAGCHPYGCPGDAGGAEFGAGALYALCLQEGWQTGACAGAHHSRRDGRSVQASELILSPKEGENKDSNDASDLIHNLVC